MRAKTKNPSDIADKFVLRLPDGLRDRIAASANEHGRSMNSDIVSRVELSLQGDGVDLRQIARDVAELKVTMERVESLCAEISRKVRPG